VFTDKITTKKPFLKEIHKKKKLNFDYFIRVEHGLVRLFILATQLRTFVDG
jgi:hypothetical protein